MVFFFHANHLPLAGESEGDAVAGGRVGPGVQVPSHHEGCLRRSLSRDEKLKLIPAHVQTQGSVTSKR